MYSILWIMVIGFEVLNYVSVSGLIKDIAPPFRYPARSPTTWSDWSDWSQCSRTCGGGVRMRSRSCHASRTQYIVPKRSCHGESTQYELCEVKDCLRPSDFVAYQCSKHNDLSISGKVIQEWVPYKNVKNPCELKCRPKEAYAAYSFGKMIDGTKCDLLQQNEQAVCVNGRCTLIDCAGLLGSDNRRDYCGVCRGNNSTCEQHENTIRSRARTDKGNHYDYNEIVRIPSGTTQILVRENSVNNFLALMDHEGIYHINGNWKIGAPGVFLVHNTRFTYNRSAGGYEQLSADGPTRFDFHIFALGTGNIPTVHYRYWLPRSHQVQSYNPIYSDQVKPTEFLITQHDVKELKPPESKVLNRKIDGYRSYYHRNEILRSVPSWSVKRHKYAHRNSKPLIVDEDTTKTSAHVGNIQSSNQIRYDESYIKNGASSDPRSISINQIGLNDKKRVQKTTWAFVDEFGRPNVSSEQSQGHRRTVTTHVNKRLSEKGKFRQSKRAGDVIAPFNLTAKERQNGRKKRKQKYDDGSCKPCIKVKQQTKQFCLSEFVLRAVVLASETLQNSTRYELQVTQSFKNRIPIASREFVWTPGTCKCPRLRNGVEYILMGSSGVTDRRSRESKLLVGPQSFVRRYTQKRARALQKLVRDQDVMCRMVR